ncbi:GFA family protein [Glacieibacterium sp.]|uniref:GFA family protein n=1 Tax=Glacieibacterium sp. TaxID=2860237 RepID=UPI003AFFED25
MTTKVQTGGCQCGAVRYSARLENDEAYWCHCRMCQRATGGVAAALLGIPRANVEWTTREPDRFASSPIAKRGYCSNCGTPLTFEFNDGSDNMDLTIGSLDDPSAVRLTSHFGAESWVPGWIPHDGLPETRTEDSVHIMARWDKARA